MKRILNTMLSAAMVTGLMTMPVYAESETSSIDDKINALPKTMLEAENVEETVKTAKEIQKEYEALSDEEKASVSNYSKLEELLNSNSTSLDPENLNEEESILKGKTIGYLGSSITVGFRSGSVAFADYIAKLTGSTSIKQAISGGPLAKKESDADHDYREAISYVTQLLDEEGALQQADSLDMLVVQLSTNDTTMGIEMGELSASVSKEDFDVSTVYGAMEYIIAYAEEKWDCPVMFYINPYIQDEEITATAEAYGTTFDAIAGQYRTKYEEMIDALYDVQNKWGIGVIDLYNEESFRTIDLDVKSYYMADIIHPYKAGYLFWYTPYIRAAMENYFNTDTTKNYVYNAAAEGYTSDYSSVIAPVYYIYAGPKTASEAEALITEMGVKENVQKYASTVTVVNPLNGTDYTEADAEKFVELLGAAVSNAKLIGIDEGADFVNNYLTDKDWAVAGIMTYNGTMEEKEAGTFVPAYLSNPTETAVNYYAASNEAEAVSDNVYENTSNSLKRVVVGSDSSLKEAFSNAWKEVFSRNYRQHNETTEFYMTSAATHTDPYLLIGIADYEALGIDYKTYYSVPLNGEGAYTWFEYIPKSVYEAEDGTVPLVVSLHGNTNDARLQGETTGWTELAAKEGFMVVAPEWQDVVFDSSTHEQVPNFFNCDGLEGDKLIEWIEYLEETYPQIDKTRIYVTGLSAGGSASVLYGLKYRDVFAAVGAVSAPGVDKAEVAALAENYTGLSVPMTYMAGDHDFFGMIPVDGSSTNSFPVGEGVYIQDVDENCSIFSFIQSYQKINGLEVSAEPDMSASAYYGIQLDNEETIMMGEKEAVTGTLSNEDGVVLQFTAIKDQAHWNYKPEAEFMWNFFKNYTNEEAVSFRLYNPNSGEHFYTQRTHEKDALVEAGWDYEGIAWASPTDSDTPVYRLYNPYAGEHLFTADAVEREALIEAGWNDEGIAFYSDDEKTVTVYREYNPNAYANNHNYTTSKEEHDTLIGLGWNEENVSFYVKEAGVPVE